MRTPCAPLATIVDSMELRATQESDRTYLARLNFLTDTFGDEHGELSPDFADDFAFYVENWDPNQGGFIAWEELFPAGGVWLNWGTEDNHGFGLSSPPFRRSPSRLRPAIRDRALPPRLSTPLFPSPTPCMPPASR